MYMYILYEIRYQAHTSGTIMLNSKQVIPYREELEKKYSALRSSYETVLFEVVSEIRDELSATNLNVSLKYRVKSFESYFGKLLKRLQNGQSADPEEITDILGVRIICPFLEDIEIAEKVVRERFDVVEVERKGTNHSFREFGYKSTHLMIHVNPDLLASTPELKGLICEVQLSTILQDAWAEVEHELVYKAEFTPFDLPLKRKLAALNANLTLADIIFQEIRDYHREMQTELRKRRNTLFERISITGVQDATPKTVESSQPCDDLVDSEYPHGLEESIDAVLLKAINAHNSGCYDEAIQLYSRLLQSDAEPFVQSIIHNHRGMAYFSKSEYAKAVADFTSAINLDAMNFRAFNYRGISYRLLKDYASALNDFNASLAINAYQPESYYSRALIYYDLGDYPRAMDDCMQALNLKPDMEAIRKFVEVIKRHIFS